MYRDWNAENADISEADGANSWTLSAGQEDVVPLTIA